MSVEVTEHGTIIDGDSIAIARLMTLRAGVKLEARGIRVSKGRSCMAIVKKEFGLKGNRAKVLSFLDEHIMDLMNRSTDRQYLPEAMTGLMTMMEEKL